MTRFEGDSPIFKQAMSIPLLSAEEEKNLACIIRNPQTHPQQRKQAIEALIKPHLRLVVSIAHKFRHYELPQEDLCQEGFLGLLHAAERFDPSRDVRFATYAQWWIRSYMIEYILRNWSMIRLGTTRSQKSLFFNLRRLRSYIPDENMSPKSVQNIARILNTTPSEVEAMAQRLSGKDSSLNVVLSDDGNEERSAFVPDESPTPEEATTAADSRAKLTQILQSAIASLPERERKILELRHLGEECATLEQIGAILKISKERVRQLEHRAILHIRRVFEAAGIPPHDLLL